MAWRSELLDDLGGADAVSAQRMALVESAVRTRLFIDHLDHWLLEQKTLVNARRKAAMPILRDRQALADSLARLLSLLGLERAARPAKTLPEIMAEIEQAKREKAQGAATPRTVDLTPETGEQAAPPAPRGTARQDGKAVPYREPTSGPEWVVTPRTLAPQGGNGHVSGIPETSPAVMDF
jgi:hypothetical protein